MIVADVHEVPQNEYVIACLGTSLPEALLHAVRAPETWVGLLQAEARQIVDALKDSADRYWRIDPRRSVDLAETIIEIGQARADTWVRALGTMAKGDAIKFIGSQQQAWDLLEAAGQLFKEVGDEVGWGRTWIGRLFIAAQLNRLPEAIEQAQHARNVFARHGEILRQLRIEMSLGEVQWLLENQVEANAHYGSALELALQLGNQGENDARAIYNNLGVIAQSNGDQRAALHFLEQAIQLARHHGEETSELICILNIAISRLRLGNYRQALSELLEVQPRYETLFQSDPQVRDGISQCLMALNRFQEVVEFCKESRQAWLQSGLKLNAAKSILQMAIAHANLGDFDTANNSLDIAATEFAQLGDAGLVAITQLRRGQVALQQGDAALAMLHTQACLRHFSKNGHIPYHAEVLLLQGNSIALKGDCGEARHVVVQGLNQAYACASPSLIYSAHLSLARIAERQGQRTRAIRRYAAAAATLERVQRNLTITMRPTFMVDKLEAQRAKTRLHLEIGQFADAFETIERARSQIALSYLTEKQALRWSLNDPLSHELVSELNELREQHHDLFSSMQTRPDQVWQLRFNDSDARTRLTVVERRMRDITEKLYLRKSKTVQPGMSQSLFDPPTLAQIQHRLNKDEVMIAYFNDGLRMHAFGIDDKNIQHVLLNADLAQIEHLINHLERNFSRYLLTVSEDISTTGVSEGLRQSARKTCRHLYDALLRPLESLFTGKARILIVPYGRLHTLPFNVLHDETGYLIERSEIVTLPSASWVLQPAPSRPKGARIIINDHDRYLSHVADELNVIRNLFDSHIYQDQTATRDSLQASPCQILHVAAHGAHRPDNPDFSHIILADGQLFTDDLLQLDLSYELVTLSACETGRGRISAGDEVLGIGWAFLYAGAGAVISSLWKVNDASTARLMTWMYQALSAGQSKADALRQAQLQMLSNIKSAHPALWGAFQLFGRPEPLTE